LAPSFGYIEFLHHVTSNYINIGRNFVFLFKETENKFHQSTSKA